MDAVRFGRWLGERRRARGWASQRALAAAARSHPRTADLAISEAFLARLEAGLLVHPFRGVVRRRVVGLAWLLCGSARQAHDYLKLAELGDLDRAETAEVNSLADSVANARAPRTVVLPPPPANLFGRDDDLAALGDTLRSTRGGCVVITGMTGIGKTALALAAAYQLAASSSGAARFADGIFFVSCSGRHGPLGACAILEDVLAVQFQGPRDRRSSNTERTTVALNDGETADGVLARLADRTRQALAGKCALVLMDGVEPDLPLDRVVAALQPHSFTLAPLVPAPSDSPDATDALAAPVLLVTTRYRPELPSGTDVHHLHVSALAPEEGIRLIERLAGTPLDGDDRKAALRLCFATSGVPLAIAAAVGTSARAGVPLVALARAVESNPLIAINGSGSPAQAIAQSLEALAPETRAQLALLSVLQAESFGLEAAAALHPASPDAALLMTADLARHSLIEPEQPNAAGVRSREVGAAAPMGGVRFRMPVLLRAYAAEQAKALPPEVLASAGHNLAAYAEALVERSHGDMQVLEAEAPLLRAALQYATREGAHERAERLVWGLLMVALRRDTCGAIERLVLQGVHAAKTLADRCVLANYLNLLGVVRFYRGDRVGARRAWAHCITVVGDQRVPSSVHGIAYLNLAQLADEEGDPDAAWHMAELGILYTRKAGVATATAGALSMQAARARRRGDRHAAHTYAREGLELLSSSGLDQTANPQQSCTLEARLELARIERDAATASACADQYFALAGTPERLFAVEALIEQGEYSLEMDSRQEARRLAGRALAIASEARAHALSRRAQAVRLRAEQQTTRWYGGAAGA